MGIPYRPEIDGLRAIAVLSVVGYHAGFGPPAGFVGVDIFFVISGYLITALLLREQPISLLGFYARRVRRILPALVVVVVSTLAASMLLLDFMEDRQQVARSATAAMLFVANLFFQRETGDYFAQAADSMPLLHLWSLAVEEQFYLIWPLLIIATPRRWLPWAVGLLAVASFATAQHWMGEAPGSAFYQAWPRFWELAVGGLIAILPARRITCYLGLPVLAFAVLLPPAGFPGFGALPAVLGAALVLAAVNAGASVPVLKSTPMRFVGRISYSLYLWHWPILALYRSTHPGALPMSVALVLCGAAFALAWISYVYVETPFRKFTVEPGKLAIGGIAACCAVALAGQVAAKSAHTEADTMKVLAQLARRDKPPNACTHKVSEPTKHNCTEGDVALWGDSMAYAWMPFAESIAPNGLAVYTRSGCTPIFGIAPDRLPDHAVCRDWKDYASKKIAGMRTLVIAGLWAGAIKEDSEAMAALEVTLDAVAPTVGRVLIIGPTPYLPTDAPRCVAEYSEACTISRATFEHEAKPVRITLARIAADHPNVEVIDPTDMLCTASECGPMKDGIVLYWDSHHISSTAAKAFSAAYNARILTTSGTRQSAP